MASNESNECSDDDDLDTFIDIGKESATAINLKVSMSLWFIVWGCQLLLAPRSGNDILSDDSGRRPINQPSTHDGL